MLVLVYGCHTYAVKVFKGSPKAYGVGFVFQNYALFRYMTVFDNVAFGLKYGPYAQKEISTSKAA